MITINALPESTFNGRAWRAEHDFTQFTLLAPSASRDQWSMSWNSGDAGGYDVADDPRTALVGALSVFGDQALAAEIVEAFMAATAEELSLAGSVTTGSGGVTIRIAYDVRGMVDGLTEADAATVAAFPWLAEARAYQQELERAGRLTATEIDAAVAAYARDLAHMYLDADHDREIEAAARRVVGIRTVADFDARAAEIRAAANAC